MDAIVFDKTGTLTSGDPQVCEVFITGEYSKEDIVRLAAAVESRLSHPAAQAIVAYAAKQKLEIPHRTQVRNSVGMGVAATVDGKRVLIGSRRLMDAKKIDTTPAEKYERDATAEGESLAYVSIDGKLAGLIAYADTRPEAVETIAKLHRRGVKKIVMATGDIETSARRIAKAIGVDEVLSSAFPENKASLVKELKRQGYVVAVVGDGINDSPALVHADERFRCGAVPMPHASMLMLSSQTTIFCV